jgi:hypothetical protein
MEAKEMAERNARLVQPVLNTFTTRVGIFEEAPEHPTATLLGLSLNLINVLLYMTNYNLVIPFLDDFCNHLHVPTSLSGAVIGCADIMAIVVSVGYSIWTHHSFKQPLIFAAAMCLAGNLLVTVAYDWGGLPLLLVGRLLTGTGAARALNRRYIADFVSIEGRTSASIGFVAASAAGMALGPFMAVPLSFWLDRYSDTWSVWGLSMNVITMSGWLMVFLWALFGIVTLLFFEEPLRRPLPAAVAARSSSIDLCIQGPEEPSDDAAEPLLADWFCKEHPPKPMREAAQPIGSLAVQSAKSEGGITPSDMGALLMGSEGSGEANSAKPASLGQASNSKASGGPEAAPGNATVVAHKQSTLAQGFSSPFSVTEDIESAQESSGADGLDPPHSSCAPCSAACSVSVDKYRLSSVHDFKLAESMREGHGSCSVTAGEEDVPFLAEDTAADAGDGVMDDLQASFIHTSDADAARMGHELPWPECVEQTLPRQNVLKRVAEDVHFLPTVACIVMLFLLKLLQQGAVSAVPLFTIHFYGWDMSGVGLFMAGMSLAMLPLNFSVAAVASMVRPCLYTISLEAKNRKDLLWQVR